MDDALQYPGRAAPVPDAVGVNDRDGPIQTDPQAFDLSAVDPAARAIEPELAQAPFQEFPRFQRLVLRRTVSADAQKDVTPVGADAEGANQGREFSVLTEIAKLVGHVRDYNRRRRTGRSRPNLKVG